MLPNEKTVLFEIEAFGMRAVAAEIFNRLCPPEETFDQASRLYGAVSVSTRHIHRVIGKVAAEIVRLEWLSISESTHKRQKALQHQCFFRIRFLPSNTPMQAMFVILILNTLLKSRYVMA